MKLAMTLMVRDEADIIAPMLDHHLAQGVDVVIVTDNGSVDGTAEILAGYADRGLIELRHDPVHRKQQGVAVTGMARDAARIHGADWVINADADEFWVPVDRSLRLADVFPHISKDLDAFTVDVVDMIGLPALEGTGLQRLAYRDQRDVAALNAVGLHAHSTPDAVHIGDPEIVVHQGNHAVSLASRGAPPEEFRMEVFHYPWRSWSQYRRKVENAGRAYLESPDLRPSPNHHGMRDFRRLQDDILFPSYLARHPDADELAAGIASGDFVPEDRIASSWPSPVPDVLIDEAASRRERALGVLINSLELRGRDVDRLRGELAERSAELDDAEAKIHDLERELDAFRSRRSVRAISAASRLFGRDG